MGFFFRKRRSFGPLALNFTKSGIGLSTGFRGLRAGLSAHRGLYASANLPGTGLYYRRYLNHHHSGESSPFVFGFWLGVLAVPIAFLIFIATR